MDCLIVQLRVPEHWHHMLLRLLMVQAVMFLCPKTSLSQDCFVPYMQTGQADLFCGIRPSCFGLAVM